MIDIMGRKEGSNLVFNALSTIAVISVQNMMGNVLPYDTCIRHTFFLFLFSSTLSLSLSLNYSPCIIRFLSSNSIPPPLSPLVWSP